MDLKALMGLWGFGARLRSSLQRWHCGEGRWQMACIRLVVVLLGGFQCRYPTWYSFDMFWSSICEGWNHRRPRSHVKCCFFDVCQQESHQNNMFLASIDEHLSIWFQLVCDDISPRHGRTSSFSGFTPKHPPQNKNRPLQSNCCKGLVLTGDIRHSLCLNKSLWGWLLPELGGWRKKLVHNVNQT